MADNNLYPRPSGDKQIVYKGIIHGIEQQEMEVAPGKIKKFEKAIRPPGTRLVIVDLTEKKILLTKEHRPEQDGWDFRLPGGKVFDELEAWLKFLQDGKDVDVYTIKAAKKEAMEEAGIKPLEIELLKKSKAGATIDWTLYYYLVTVFEENSGQNLGDGENIEVVWKSFDEAIELILDGNMKEDRSVGILLPYLIKNK